MTQLTSSSGESKPRVLIFWRHMQDLLIMRGRPYVPEEPEPEPKVLPGSCIAFTCNGELQGVAYRSTTNPYYANCCQTPLFLLPHNLLVADVRQRRGAGTSNCDIGTWVYMGGIVLLCPQRLSQRRFTTDFRWLLAPEMASDIWPYAGM